MKYTVHKVYVVIVETYRDRKIAVRVFEEEEQARRWANNQYSDYEIQEVDYEDSEDGTS